MVGKQIREVRCSDVLDEFCKDSSKMCFMTLTTPDVCDLMTIRARWRRFRHYLVEREKEKGGGAFKFVMNFELHPRGHGWHIHAVFNRYINLRGGGLNQIRRYGFGMVNVKRVTSRGVADYLSKHCLKAYRGVRGILQHNGKRLRLVNTSRGLPVLDGYKWRSEHLQKVVEFARSKYVRETTGLSSHKLMRCGYADLAVTMGWGPEMLDWRLRNRVGDIPFEFSVNPNSRGSPFVSRGTY